MSLSEQNRALVERIRSEMAGVDRWHADTRGTLLFECLEAFARAEGVAALQQAGEPVAWLTPGRYVIDEQSERGHYSNGDAWVVARKLPRAISREEIAREIDPDAWDRWTYTWPPGRKEKSLAKADAILSKLSPLPQQTDLVEEGVEKIIAPHEPAACGEGTLPSPSDPPRSAGGAA